VDFTAGGCHAMGGEQGMLAEGVFIFTPMGVSVVRALSSPHRSCLSSSALLRVSQPAAVSVQLQSVRADGQRKPRNKTSDERI
jgi:hypothetical protein